MSSSSASFRINRTNELKCLLCVPLPLLNVAKTVKTVNRRFFFANTRLKPGENETKNFWRKANKKRVFAVTFCIVSQRRRDAEKLTTFYNSGAIHRNFPSHLDVCSRSVCSEA